MSRYIDADKIPYVISENGCLDDFAYRYDINEVPTADVVEVCRCKDCKYFEMDDDGFTYCVASIGLDSKMAVDYCSYGERREENER